MKRVSGKKIKSIFRMMLNVSDQLLLTFWFFFLVFCFSNIFSKQDFIDYSLFYALQSIVLLYVNSSVGQLFLLEGRLFNLVSILVKIQIHGVLVFVVTFIILFFNVIKLNNTSIENIVLISVLVSLFCSFELYRRVYYAYGFYKQSLYSVLLLIGLSIIGYIVILFIKVLDFKIFLIYTTIAYFIAVYYSTQVIKRLTRSKEQKALKRLKYKYIIAFSKWLLLGTTAYIISSQLFIFYLNDYGRQDDVITYRLLQSSFGVILVFVAAYENYFISSLKPRLNLRETLNSIKNYWCLFIVGLILVMPFINTIMLKLLNAPYKLDHCIVIIVFLYYFLMILTRSLVIYLRLHKYNLTIFVANFITGCVVLVLFILKIELSLFEVYVVMTSFPLVNLFIYLIPYFKNEKKYFNNSRIWP